MNTEGKLCNVLDYPVANYKQMLSRDKNVYFCSGCSKKGLESGPKHISKSHICKDLHENELETSLLPVKLEPVRAKTFYVICSFLTKNICNKINKCSNLFWMLPASP